MNWIITLWIGYKKLSKFVDEHKEESFALWNGTRTQIKRVLFEKYIDEKLDVI
ncbi:excisionase [Konateibacter massiliensis]|uniref:excisionase n=1 Tax=Konateibacter massiliensis TaxID=2002841 RepID=UPI000C1469C6|nr:excisionase [Konateibacter massiliensis]